MADTENTQLWVENPFGEDAATQEIERYNKQGLGALAGAGAVAVAAVVVAAVVVVVTVANAVKG